MTSEQVVVLFDPLVHGPGRGSREPLRFARGVDVNVVADDICELRAEAVSGEGVDAGSQQPHVYLLGQRDGTDSAAGTRGESFGDVVEGERLESGEKVGRVAMGCGSAEQDSGGDACYIPGVDPADAPGAGGMGQHVFADGRFDPMSIKRWTC